MSSPKPPPRDLPKPIDVQRALSEALAELRPLGGEYVLIGGVALGAYGVERFTKHIDLACTVAQSTAAQNALLARDPQPLAIGGVSIATSGGVRVDLIDRRVDYRGLFEEAIADAKQSGQLARAGDLEIPVVSLPYLVAMKLIADRPQDEVDLGALLRIDALDYPRTRDIVRRWAGPYAAGRLDKLARAAGRTDAPRDYTAGDS